MKRLVSLLISTLLCVPSGFAQTVTNTPTTAGMTTTHSATASSSATSTPSPINLDLSSTHASLTDSKLTAPVILHVGSTTLQVNSTTALTPAELAAVHQVLNTGAQTLTIGSNGAATGGTMVLSSYLSSNLGNLVIPQGVSIIDNVAKTAGTLNIIGNLTNSGTLDLVSSSAQISTAHLVTTNVVNNASGLITTNLLPQASAALSGLQSVLDLSISSAQSVVNNGIISSSGALNISAGTSITNGIAGMAASNAAATMTAVNNLAIQAPTIANFGNLVSTAADVNVIATTLQNGGALSAASGNIGINSLLNTLFVDNTAGTINALGNATFNTSVLTGLTTSPFLHLQGGTVNGASINFNSPGGAITISTDHLNGPVYVSGDTADVNVSKGNLVLSSLNVHGDPIVSAAGNLTLAATTTGGADFIALANGDIDGAAISINTASASANGGKIVLAAGVNFTVSNAACSVCTAGTDYAITGVSATGGSIVASSTQLTTNSATVNLQAHAVGANAGTIDIGNIKASGAGAVGSAAGGGITIVGDGTVTVHNPGGGSSLAVDGKRTGGAGTIGAGGGTVNVTSNNGNIVLLSSLNAEGGSGQGGTSTVGGAGGSGGSVVLQASNGSISLTDVHLAGGGGGGGAVGQAGGPGGAGGSATITAGTGITQTNELNASGGGGGGGGSLGAGGAGGQGGNISISSTTGTVSLGSALSAVGGSGGAGNATNGGGGGGSWGFAGGGGAGTIGGNGGGGDGPGGGGGTSGGGNGGPSGSGGAGGGGNAATFTGGVGIGNTSAAAAFVMGGAGGTGASGGSNGATGNASFSLSAPTVQLTKTTSSLFTTGSPCDNCSAVAGTLNITQGTTGVSSTVYSSDANYLNDSRNFTAAIRTGNPFTAGAAINPGIGGSLGTLLTTSGTTINGTTYGTNLTSGTYGGTGTVSVNENGSLVTITNGQLITPAEWIAVIQAFSGGQTLTLDATGNAIGGSFKYAAANIPASNFTNLNLPGSVTATSSVSILTFSGTATIAGTLAFTGSGTMSAGGGITTPGGIIQASTLVLSSTSGSIGSTTTALSINAATLTANANAAGAVVNINDNASGLTMAGASAANTSFTASVAGNLTVQDTATVTAPIIVLNAGGAAGVVSVVCSACSSTTHALNASNYLQISDVGSALTSQFSNETMGSGTLYLTSTAGNIGTATTAFDLGNDGAVVNVQAVANSSGAFVNLHDTGGTNFIGNSLAATSFAFVSDPVVGPANVAVSAGATINAQSISMTANGSGGTASTFTVGAGAALTAANSISVTAATEVFTGSTTATAAASTISLTSPSNQALTVQAGATSATLQTNGGSISINPATGQSLTFAQSGTGSATLNLNGGAVTATVSGAGTASVNSGVTVASNRNMTLNINGTTLTNNGTITSSNATGSISVLSTGALTLAGTGTISATGTGSTLTVTDSGAMNLTGNNTFIADKTVLIDAAGGVMTISGSNTLTAGTAGTARLTSEKGTGSINITAGTQTFTGGVQAMIDSPTVTVGSGATVKATSTTPLFRWCMSTLNDNGTITSAAAGGEIELDNTGQPGSLTLQGTPNAITMTGTSGAAEILIQDYNASQINFNSSFSFNAGSGGTVWVQSTSGTPSATSGVINFAAGTTATGAGSLFMIYANTVNINSNATNTVSNTTGTLQYMATTFNDNGNINSATPGGLIQIDDSGLSGGLVMTGTPTSAIAETGGGAAQVAVYDYNSASITFNSAYNLSAGTGAGSNVLIQSTGGAINFAAGSGTQTLTAQTGTVQAATTTTLNSGTTIQATNGMSALNLIQPTLINSGTISDVTAAASIKINNSGNALTIGGTAGRISITGGGSAAIVASASGANAISLTGTQTWDAGASGSVAFNSQSAAGSVSLGASSTQTIGSGSALTISTPSLTFAGDNATITTTGASSITLNSGTGASSLIITAFTGASNDTIATTGGTINITPTSGQSLTFAQSAAGTATINLNAAALTTTTSGGATTINSGVSVASTGNISSAVNGSTFTNNGKLQSAGAGGIQLSSTSTLTLAGTGILAEVNATPPTTSITATTSLTLATGTNQQITGGALSITTPVLNGPGSGNVSTIATNVGSISISPASGSLTVGAGGTINLNTGNTNTVQLATLTDMTINAGTKLASDSNITLSMPAGILTNNGTVTSSAANGVVQILDTVSNTASLFIAGTGTFSATGGGTAAVSVINPNAVNITYQGSLTWSAGATGTINWGTASNPYVVAVVFAPGATQTISGGSTLNVTVQLLTLQGGTAISSSASVNFGSTSWIDFRAPSGGTAGVTTTAGNISITPAAGRGLTFAQTGTGNATLNLNGGAVTATVSGAGTLDVNSGVTAASDKNVTFNVNGTTLNNNGTITSANAGGSVNVLSTAALTVNGTGTISTTGGGASAVKLSSNGTTSFTGGVLTIQSPTTTVSATAISFASSLSSNGSVSLDSSAGNGNIKQSAGTVSATSLAFKSGSGSIGNATLAPYFYTSAPSMTITSTGSVAISNSGAGALTVGGTTGSANVVTDGNLTTGGLTASSGPLQLTSNTGNLSVAGASSALSDVTLTANSGSISLSNTLNGANVNLSSGSGGMSQTAAGVITSAGTLTVNLPSGGTADFSTATNSIGTLSGSGSGGIKLNDGTADLKLGTFSPAVSVTLTAAGNLTTTASTSMQALTATATSLTTSNALTVGTTNVTTTGDITIGAGYSAAGTTSFTSSTGNVGVASGGSINNSAGTTTLSAANGSVSIGGTINSPNLTLTSGSAGITQSAAGGITTTGPTGLTVNIASGGTAALNTAANSINEVSGSGTGVINLNNGANIVLNTFAANQNVNVSTTGAITSTTGSTNVGTLHLTSGIGGTTLSESITGSGAFQLDSSGTLTVNSAVTTSGAVTSTAGALSVGAAGTLKGASIVLTTPSITNNGTIATTGGNLQVGTTSSLTVTNNATMQSTGTLSFSGTNGISITGPAGSTLSATGGVSANSIAGAVNISQDTISGTVSGTAATSFAAAANAAGTTLTSGTITAQGGNLSLSASSSNLAANGPLTAQNNISLNAGTALSVANGGTMQAGSVSSGNNATSTNMGDYDSSGIQNVGGIGLTSAGTLSIGNNTALKSTGAAISAQSAGNLTVGTGGSMFAQGGNVLLNSTAGNVTINGGTYTAVARTVAGGGTQTTNAGQVLPKFNGGGIAIYSGNAAANLPNILQADVLNRIGGGSYTAGAGVTLTTTTFSYVPNGGLVSLLTQGGGTIAMTNTTVNANGGVFDVDPPTGVTITGATFLAVGPVILPPPPPIPPAPPALGAATPSSTTATSTPLLFDDFSFISSTLTAVDQATTAGAQGRSVTPVDSNKSVSSPIISLPMVNSCVPAPMAQYNEGDKNSTWSVASGYCQAFAFQDKNGATVVGAGGTAIAPAGDHGLQIKEGKLMAIAGSSPLTVTTAQGTITLPADSSALIEQKGKGVVRVAFITGSNGSFQVEKNGQSKVISAQPGQELVVAPTDTDDEELIPTDGVDRIEVTARVTIASAVVRTNSLNRRELIEKDGLLNCNNSCYPVYIRTKFNKIKATAGKPDTISNKPPSRLPNVSTGNGSSHFKPVAYQPSAPATADRLSTFELADATIKYSDKTKFKIEDNGHINLSAGEMVLSTHKPTVIETSQAKATIEPNTVAAVWSDGKAIRIRSLYADKTDAVKCTSNMHSMSASAGQEIVVTDSDKTMQRFQGTDNCGRRRVRMHTLPDGRVVMTSEVSYVSVITQSPVLMKIFSSKNESDAAIGEKLKKIAVCLSIVTGSHGPFSAINPNH